MNHIKVFIIATFAAISGLMIGAALGNQAAQAQQPQHFFTQSPVVLKAEPAPAKPGENIVVMVAPGPDSLLRLALDTRDVENHAAAHGYKVAVAAVCDAKCQAKLQAMPSVAMAAQSFGVQFIRGDATTVQRLVSQGWIQAWFN